MTERSASAVPERLFAYSAATSRAGNDLLAWIRGVLAPAVRDYQTGAVDAGSAIKGLTLPASLRRAESVDFAAVRAVTRALRTDQAVHDVGQAFADAGSGAGVHQYSAITVEDSIVDRLLAEGA